MLLPAGRLGALAAGLLLLACTSEPVSVERAMAICTNDAIKATRPTGKAAIGIGNGGPSLGLQIGVTSDFLTGRDPNEVYETCVMRRSGQAPTRPLAL